MILYDDGRTRLDERGVTLRRYYFPTAQSKTVAYSRIIKVESRPLGWLSGRLRLWGTSWPLTWLPLDLGRTTRDVLVSLDVGGRVRPSFTPDDPASVLAVLAERAGR